MIEIDSNKLVINLNPLGKSQKVNEPTVKKPDRYERLNNYANLEQAGGLKLLTISKANQISVENKNISKLFFTVERFAFHIEKPMKQSEIEDRF